MRAAQGQPRCRLDVLGDTAVSAKPEPPAHLGAMAREAWEELVTTKETGASLVTLEAMAVQVARMRDAQRRIDQEGLVIAGARESRCHIRRWRSSGRRRPRYAGWPPNASQLAPGKSGAHADATPHLHSGGCHGRCHAHEPGGEVACRHGGEQVVHLAVEEVGQRRVVADLQQL